MNIWPGWRLSIRMERRKPRRCRFTQRLASGPSRCIFEAGHPPHGHTCTSDLSAAPIPSPGLLADRRRS